MADTLDFTQALAAMREGASCLLKGTEIVTTIRTVEGREQFVECNASTGDPLHHFDGRPIVQTGSIRLARILRGRWIIIKEAKA